MGLVFLYFPMHHLIFEELFVITNYLGISPKKIEIQHASYFVISSFVSNLHSSLFQLYHFGHLSKHLNTVLMSKTEFDQYFFYIELKLRFLNETITI